MKILRIACSIIACLFILAAIPIGIVTANLSYVLIDLLAAAVFAVGTIFFKRLSEPRIKTTDFMNTDEENAAIREALDAEKHDETKPE